MMNSTKCDERNRQIEEMATIWAAGDEYGKGYLNGVIDTVIRLVTGRDEKRPAV